MDSQEFSPVPQFENINASALSLLYGPTLTSLLDWHGSEKLFLANSCLSSEQNSWD